jgi:hypothetical protein
MLVDVEPIVLEPTWLNKRGETQAIIKQLDWFFIKEYLITKLASHKISVLK